MNKTMDTITSEESVRVTFCDFTTTNVEPTTIILESWGEKRMKKNVFRQRRGGRREGEGSKKGDFSSP